MNGAPPIAPVGPATVDVTILICTYNRAEQLAATLDSIARLEPPRGITWDVLVVDNSSTDRTTTIVESRIAAFPVSLRYVFEPAPGKSNALNTGMRTTSARIIVFTDDDVRVAPQWLEAAVRPLWERNDIDYTGGPVRPLWGGPRPSWLDERGNLGGTIAVKDHGPVPFAFEDRKKTPLGVNMAVRRSLIERIGGFRPDLGRTGGSLLGQEQAEFFYRSRAAGARGLYLPAMVVEHVVPPSRLTTGYFLRWWYWKGVSHARVHEIHQRTELGLDMTRVPRLAGVPRFVITDALRDMLGGFGCIFSGSRARRMEHAVMLAYAWGYVHHCRDSAPPTPGERSRALANARP